MRLFRINPRLFKFKKYEVMGVGLGSENGGGLTVVKVSGKRVLEPDPEKWGLRPTSNMHPCIQGNHNPDMGWIALFSTFNGPSHSPGMVYVLSEFVTLVAAGHGENLSYHDVLLEFSGPALLWIERTNPPHLQVTVLAEGITETEAVLPPIDIEDYLKYTELPRWQPAPNNPAL